jgi:hypothetical protein
MIAGLNPWQLVPMGRLLLVAVLITLSKSGMSPLDKKSAPSQDIPTMSILWLLAQMGRLLLVVVVTTLLKFGGYRSDILLGLN